MLSAEGSRDTGSPLRSTSQVEQSATERVAQIRLKREHDKLVARLGVAGGLAMLVVCILLLAVADGLGRAAGAAFVLLIAASAAVGFVALFVPRYAEPFANRMPAPQDPLTGRPMRMLWWWRCFAAAAAVLMFVAFGDYTGAGGSQTAASSASSESHHSAAQPAVSDSIENHPVRAPNAAPASIAPDADTAASTSPVGVEEYRAEIQDEARTLGRSSQEVVRLFAKESLDPEVLLDNSWGIQMGIEFALWQATYEEAKKRAAPPSYASFNEKWVRSLEILASAGRDYVRGIDDQNRDEIESANEEMESATHQVKSALVEF
jgi:hypothetical protein